MKILDLSYEQEGDREEIVVVEEAVVPSEEKQEYRGERIGRWCLYLILGIGPFIFLPFAAAPASAGKFFAVLIVALVGLAGVLAAGIRRRSIPYPASTLAVSVALLFGVHAISAWFSVSPRVSVWGYLSSPDGLAAFFVYLVVFYLGSTLLRREDLLRAGAWFAAGVVLASFLNVLQLTGVFLFPWALAQGNGFLPSGSLFGWGILLGALLTGATLVPSGESPRARAPLRLLIIVVALGGLIVLNYPILWVLVAALMVVVSALRFAERRPLGFPIAVAAVAVLFAFLGSRLPALVSLPLEIRPSASSSFETMAPALFGPRFLAGSGPATFNYLYERYRAADLNATPWWNVRFGSAYNAVLTTVATGGLLAFLGLLFFAASALRAAFRGGVEDPRFHPFVGGMVFFFLAWLFYPAVFMGQVAVFAIAGALAGLCGERRVFSIEGESRARTIAGFLGFALLFVILLSVAYGAGVSYLAGIRHLRAAEALRAGNGDRALAELESAVLLDDASDVLLRDASQILAAKAESVISSGGAASRTPELQALVARAVFAARRATEVNSADALNWANAGNVYERFIPFVAGAGPFADESYRNAMERNPRSPEFPVLAARALLAAPGGPSADSGRAAEVAARVLLEKSIGLKPDYAPAHFLFVQLLFREGDVGGAVARVEALKAANPFDAGMAFQLGLLYYGQNQMPRARAEFERAVGISADFANARYFLGLVYDRLGLPAEAAAQFRRVAELNPGNAEVERILANLAAGRGALADIVPPAAPPESRAAPPVSDDAKLPNE